MSDTDFLVDDDTEISETDDQNPPSGAEPDSGVGDAAHSSTPTPHVPGGLPAVPLTVIGANTTVAAVSAAVVAAGGLATGLAAGGVVAAATGAAALRRRARARQTNTSSNGSAGARAGGLRGRATAARTGRAAGASAAGRRGGSGARTTAGRAGGTTRPARGTGASRSSGAAKGAGRSGARSLRAAGVAAKQRARDAGRTAKGASARAKGALGAVRAARAARQAAGPTRGQRRSQDSAGQRRLADARRAAKDARKQDKRAKKAASATRGGSGHSSAGRRWGRSKSPKSGAGGHKSGANGRGGGRGGGAGKTGRTPVREKLRQARQQARARARAVLDKVAAGRLSRARAVRRRAGARARMWRRLTTSALRCYARKALAVAVAVPFFAIGMLTHPLGERLGWRWLMWPGQRVYRALAHPATRARQARDAAIRADYAAQVTAATGPAAAPVAAKVRRAPRTHTTHRASSGGSSMTTPAGPGFLFNEAASDMENAAASYNPDGMMHVHDTIQGFPDALESVANTFAILARKADDEMPLEPEVGAALDQIYKALQQAIDEAEEAFKVFRTVHEQDIKRHESPRNGDETGWDTTNN